MTISAGKGERMVEMRCAGVTSKYMKVAIRENKDLIKDDWIDM